MRRTLLLLAVTLLTGAIALAQAPGVAISPTYLSASVLSGHDTTVTTHIYNNSSGEINFTFPAFTDQAERGSGGPDAYGYRWIDSDESNYSYAWVEISGTGTEVTGLADDNIIGPFDIGFTFPYYNHTQEQFWINSNGLIQFSNNPIIFANYQIPTNNSYVNFIAAMWDDLNLNNDQSHVYYQTFSEQTVIQFQDAHLYYNPGTVTFEVIIRINGTVLINFKEMSEDFLTTSNTIGIQSSEPGVGLQVSFNEEYIHNELGIKIYISNDPADFIVSVEPASGMIPAYSNAEITLTYSAAGFDPGSYQETAVCTTDYPDYESLPVYNLMLVMGNPRIVGTIRNATTNAGLGGVIVTAGAYTATTGENGHYDMVVDPGTYVMTFTKEGFTTETRDGITVSYNQTREVSLAMSPVTDFILGGTVFAGIYQLDMGYVNALKMTEGQVTDIFADLIDTLGYYNFPVLGMGNYRVKAEPSFGSVYEGGFLPTYYGDVVHWADAQMIELNQNIFNADIHLVEASLNNSNGPCSIAGTIYQAGDYKSGNSGVPAANIQIFIRQGNAYAMTLSDNEGHFDFNNLEFGTYTMFAELIGKNSEFRNITLGQSNENSLSNDLFIYDTDILYGIDDPLPGFLQSAGKPYPNPACSQVSIGLNLLKPVALNVALIDVLGQTVYNESSTRSAGSNDLSIPLETLKKGIYWMRISDGNGESLTRKIIKN